jgi:glycosyltransferase involved in cell wall biosynthesis
VPPHIPLWVDEVIIVDNSRPTEQSTRQTADTNVVLRQERLGKGAALRSGFAAARGDIIVTLDADGSTDPAEIPAFVGALLAGADFVKGSRFAQGGGTDDMEWYRRLGNWGLLQLVRLRFGGRFTDLCYGYNALAAYSSIHGPEQFQRFRNRNQHEYPGSSRWFDCVRSG